MGKTTNLFEIKYFKKNNKIKQKYRIKELNLYQNQETLVE